MKKIFMAAFLLVTMMLTGCGGGEKSAAPEKTSAGEKNSATAQAAASDKKILVVYFSRTGEEYGIGKISKGNTAIIAEMIAQKVDADLFEVKPATPYPDSYEACTELAKRELEQNVRPALANNIGSLAQYDTVFVGYPIWWGAVPRVMMTFLEANDFGGKKVIPFCTHGGSGLAGTVREISAACPNSKVLDGLAIVGRTAQNDSAAAKKDVDAWLKTLGY